VIVSGDSGTEVFDRVCFVRDLLSVDGSADAARQPGIILDRNLLFNRK